MLKALLEIVDLGDEGSRCAQWAVIGVVCSIVFPAVAIPVALVCSTFIAVRGYRDVHTTK